MREIDFLQQEYSIGKKGRNPVGYLHLKDVSGKT